MRILILFFLVTINLFSQYENHNWYFGYSAGITFSTSSKNPISLSGNIFSQYEGSATISDNSGKLLLYTDGINVYNRFHSIINNLPLKGHSSSSQSAIILKKPLNDNIFYIFTADASDYIDPPNDGLNYCIVDVSANDSACAILDYNVLLTKPATEKLTATYHKNGRDIWILGHLMYSNQFVAYLLSSTGIVDTVYSSIGTVHESGVNSIGYMKVSPRQNLIALVKYDSNLLELFKFDNSTGIISDSININLSTLTNYGVEFSPNGALLYVSQRNDPINKNYLSQFNITAYNQSDIQNSRVELASEGTEFGALQLAPNNKIYIARIGNYLSCIEKPNLIDTLCSYNSNVIRLSIGECKLGLPGFIPIFPNQVDFTVCEGNNFSLDPEDFLKDTLNYPFNYNWSGPNSFNSKQPIPYFTDAKFNMSGIYLLTVTFTINGVDTTLFFKNNVEVVVRPNISINGKTEICQGDTTTLIALPIISGNKYLWNNKTTRSSIKATKSGNYSVIVTSASGCKDTAYVTLKVFPQTVSKITGTNVICQDKFTKLSSKYLDTTFIYKWSTGDTLSEITVNSTNKYWLKVTNKLGCFAIDTFNVQFVNNLQADIIGQDFICGNTPTKLSVSTNVDSYNPDLIYDWSTGEKTKDIIISKFGIYHVSVLLNGTCVSLDTINIKRIEKPTILLNLKDTVKICSKDSVFFEVQNPQTYFSYIWSTGSTNLRIKPLKSGLYTAYVSNANKCIDSAIVYLDIYESPVFKIFPAKIIEICQDDTLEIGVSDYSLGLNFLWSTGENTPSIKIHQPKSYKLIIYNQRGCNDSILFNLKKVNYLPISIYGQSTFCEGDSLILNTIVPSKKPDHIYDFTWNDGSKNETLIAKDSGWYKVKVQEIGGCSGSDSIFIKKISYPKANLNLKSSSICDGDSVIVEALPNNSSFTYYWDDGFNVNKRTFRKSGIYILKISNQNSCSIQDTFFLRVLPLPKNKIITKSGNIFCNGTSLLLESQDNSDSLDYLWFDGTTGKNVTVNKSGEYWLSTKNSIGCVSSDTIEVIENPLIDFKIQSDKKTLCINDFATLTCSKDFQRYQWSNGSDAKTIKVNNPGKFKVQVWDSNGCNSEQEITIDGMISSINPNVYMIDFGNHCLNEEVLQEIEISNNSDFDANLTKINPLSSNISLNNLNLPILIKSKSKTKISLNYSSKTAQKEIGKIEFLFDKPCLDSFYIDFNATTSIKGEMKVSNEEAEAGAEVCFKVNSTIICDVNLLTNYNYLIFEISMAYNIFRLKSLSIGELLSETIYGDSATLRIKIFKNQISEFFTNGIKVCGNTLIGKYIETDLKPNKLSLENELISLKSISGILVLKGCIIDLRSFGFYEPAKLISKVENGNIELYVSSGETGYHEIQLYNFSGNLIDKIAWYQENKLIDRKEIFKTLNLSSGLYVIIFKSPMGLDKNKILFLK